MASTSTATATPTPIRYGIPLEGIFGGIFLILGIGTLLGIAAIAITKPNGHAFMTSAATWANIIQALFACIFGGVLAHREHARYTAWQTRDPGKLGFDILRTIGTLGGKGTLGEITRQLYANDHGDEKKHASERAIITALHSRLVWLGFVTARNCGKWNQETVFYLVR